MPEPKSEVAGIKLPLSDSSHSDEATTISKVVKLSCHGTTEALSLLGVDAECIMRGTKSLGKVGIELMVSEKVCPELG